MMEQTVRYLQHPYFLFPAITITATLLLLLLRLTLLRFASSRSDGAGVSILDILLTTIRSPSVYWCLALGLHLGITFSDIPQKYAEVTTKVITVLIIFSITFVLANFSGTLFTHVLQKADLPLTRTGLAQAIVKGGILPSDSW